MASRFLIIGGSGLVGKSLRRALPPDRTTATYRTRPFAGGIRFDATASRLADAVLRRDERYSHAFLLLGITSIDACEKGPDATAQTNVGALCSLIDQLVAAGIVPVFASSDAVFDGSRGLWKEEDPVCPILAYGAQKARVERHLAERGAPHLIVRLAKVVTSDPDEPGVIKEWMDKLEAGTKIQCARDQRFSPVDAADVTEALTALALRQCTGIFHVCGPRPVTRLEFLEMLVEEVKRYRPIAPNIAQCRLNDLFEKPRPLDASMACDKVSRALGMTFRDMRQVCRDAAHRRYGGASQPARSALTREGAR